MEFRSYQIAHIVHPPFSFSLALCLIIHDKYKFLVKVKYQIQCRKDFRVSEKLESAAMADQAARQLQYEYKANSNLVLQVG